MTEEINKIPLNVDETEKLIIPKEKDDEIELPKKVKKILKMIKKIEESMIEFRGETHRIYKEDIFKIQIKELLKREFGKEMKGKEIKIYNNEEEDRYEYKVEGLMVKESDRVRVNDILKNQRIKKSREDKDYYPQQVDLYEKVDSIYNTHHDLIFIGRQLIKDVKDKHGKLIYEDNNDKPVKYYPFEYGYYERRDVDKIIEKIGENRHLYEILQWDVALKPFFDLEMELELTKEEKEEKLDLFLELLLKELRDLYTFYIDKEDIVIIDSNTEKKLSYHIIINEKIYFKTMGEHKEFVEYLLARFDTAIGEEKELVEKLTWKKIEKDGREDERYIFDASVYTRNRQFRMLNQSKKGKDAVLKLVSNHKIKDTFVQYDERIKRKTKIDTKLLSQYFHQEFKKDKKERRTIQEIRKKTKKGDIIEKLDYNMKTLLTGLTLQDKYGLSDHEVIKMDDEIIKYMYVIPIQSSYEEWLKIGMAIKRAGGKKELWEEWSQLGVGYRKGECEGFDKFEIDENVKGYSLKTLRWIAMKCKPILFKEFSVIYQILYKLDLEGIEKRIEDSDYLSQEGTPYGDNIYTDKRCLLINSSMGKGKTQAIKRIMKKEEENKQCLFLSTRRTFAYFIQGEFEDFYNYLDIKNHDLEDLQKSDKVIISLESILKLGKERVYDFVVVDESETLLSNFSSETLGNKTYEIYDTFENILINARKVVVMDAFLSNRSLQYMKGLYKNENILYIENKKINTKIQARMMNYRANETFLKIYEYIKNGEKLYMTFSSNKKMMQFKEFLYRRMGKDEVINDLFINKMLVYNKDTTKRDMERLMDINKIWKEASIIMTTPKITVGCSYNPDGDKENPTFDRKISFAMHTCTARDMFQSIMRVRHIKQDKGLDFGIGINTTTHMEKTFLLLEDFNNYEDGKTKYIIKELKELVETRGTLFNQKEIIELKSMITYLDMNKSNHHLRQILYYNALEVYMSQNYYKDYYLTLLKEVGFELIKDEEKKEKEMEESVGDDTEIDDEDEKKEKNELLKDTEKEEWKDEEYINQYQKIRYVCCSDIQKLERKQKENRTTKEENMMLEKYHYERYIHPDTENIKRAKIYYRVWMESQRRRCIKNDYYYCLTKEEIMKEQTHKILCTEKMDYIWDKISIIKDLEELIGIEHDDYEKVITKDEIKQCSEYLTKNTERIYKIFKLRDYGKKDTLKEATGKELNICIQRLNKIFKDFNGNEIKGNDYKGSRAVNYKLKAIIPEYSYKYIQNNIEDYEQRINVFDDINRSLFREDRPNKCKSEEVVLIDHI